MDLNGELEIVPVLPAASVSDTLAMSAHPSVTDSTQSLVDDWNELIEFVPNNSRQVPRWLVYTFSDNEMELYEAVSVLMDYVLSKSEKEYAQRYGIKLLENIEVGSKIDFVGDAVNWLLLANTPRESFSAICQYLREGKLSAEPEDTFVYPEERLQYEPMQLTRNDFTFTPESDSPRNSEE